MNTSRFLYILLFVVALNLFAEQELTPSMKANPPMLKPEELEMTVSTDKTTYRPGEPISLNINIINKTDRKVEILTDRRLTFAFIKIEVTAIKDADANGASSKPTILKRKEEGPLGSWIPLYITPHGTRTTSIPLQKYYDLTLPNVSYKVHLKRWISDNYQHGFNLEGSTEFSVRGEALTSAASYTALYLERLFGKEKAIEILCGKAEEAIAKMEESQVAEIEKAVGFNYLMVVLRTLDELTVPARRLSNLEARNMLTLKELNNFVNTCKLEYRN